MSSHFLQAFSLQVVKLVVWLALLAVIFTPLEALFALHRTPGRWKTAPADIAFYFLNSLLPLAILAPPLAALSVGLRLVTPHAYAAAVTALPVFAKLAAALAVSEVALPGVPVATDSVADIAVPREPELLVQ